MKNKNTDSTANVSRFARDKRQRVSTAEHVERSPRPRREADSEGGREFRTPAAKTEKRTSYNPHFTADNRLRPEYEQRPRRNDDGERAPRSFNRPERGERTFNREERNDRGFGRTERGERSFNRGERTERTFNREERNNDRGFKGGAKRGGATKRDEKPRSYPKYNPNQATGEIRLNRFISQSGVCSRREADDFILAGVVTVNGQVVTGTATQILSQIVAIEMTHSWNPEALKAQAVAARSYALKRMEYNKDKEYEKENYLRNTWTDRA